VTDICVAGKKMVVRWPNAKSCQFFFEQTLSRTKYSRNFKIGLEVL
jgi:hypothetical protein